MLFAKEFQELEAEVWSEVPAALRRPGVESDWGTANFRQAVDCFLEGPDFDSQGNLYVVDIPFGRIFRIDAVRHWSVAAEYAGWPNGLKCQADGSLLIADYRRGLVRIHADGTVEDALSHRHSEHFRGLNDLTAAREGVLFFTDQGQSGMQDPSGRVYRWQPDSGMAPSLLLDRIPSPNGLALNPAGTQLYVAVTRDNAIWRLPLQSDGSVSKVGRWIQLSGGTGPDGIACDAAGNLWVAHIGLGCVWCFNPRGEAVLRVHTPGEWPTNLVVHPHSGDVLIVESQRGQILRVPPSFLHGLRTARH